MIMLGSERMIQSVSVAAGASDSLNSTVSSSSLACCAARAGAVLMCTTASEKSSSSMKVRSAAVVSKVRSERVSVTSSGSAILSFCWPTPRPSKRTSMVALKVRSPQTSLVVVMICSPRALSRRAMQSC